MTDYEKREIARVVEHAKANGWIKFPEPVYDVEAIEENPALVKDRKERSKIRSKLWMRRKRAQLKAAKNN